MELPLAKARMDFPLLTQRVRGRPVVYLDSAATALKPWPVIERLSHFYSYETANVHRGAHYLADQATGFFEQSREKVQSFLRARLKEEIIFTKGTTESLNLVAQAWGRKNLKPGDEVLISEMEHHANLVPWQMICQETGARLKVTPISEAGELDMRAFEKSLSSQTKVVAVTHCSNTLGTINDLKLISSLAHKVGAIVVGDGAQMVANHPVNVQNLGVDFYAFSGHKLFGPYGVGVLYGRHEVLRDLPPYQGGGSMISEVTFSHTTYQDAPFRFEAGTPNISGVIALGAAIDYVQKLGWEKVQAHEQALLQYATSQVQEVPGLRVIGQAQNKAPILSLVMEGLHHSDIGQILDQENIAVRAGHHCTQPLLAKLGLTGTVRASFSVFNQQSDVDALVKGLWKARELLS